LPDARSLQGTGRSAVHVGDKAEERIPLVSYDDEEYEAGFEDTQRRLPDVARIERTVGWKPSRSLEETLRDIIRSCALSCGSHG
jgi:nucleoside-diphosphate-sugar epimerase